MIFRSMPTPPVRCRTGTEDTKTDVPDLGKTCGPNPFMEVEGNWRPSLSCWGERRQENLFDRFDQCVCNFVVKRQKESLPEFSLGHKSTIGIKIITLHNFSIQKVIFPITYDTLQNWFRINSPSCNVLCCCKAYHVDIKLHYSIIFELIYRLIKSILHYRIGFKLNVQ